MYIRSHSKLYSPTPVVNTDPEPIVDIDPEPVIDTEPEPVIETIKPSISEVWIEIIGENNKTFESKI